ncbi:hypothetical protein DSM104299_01810 [Baekduia alba]|nr:hypothetical protein DSM104299_01810 [Baekduia alba]
MVVAAGYPFSPWQDASGWTTTEAATFARHG